MSDPGRPGDGAPAGFDGYAIAALVTSLVGCVPLGLVFGVLALRRIGRTGQQGRGLAIFGIVLSVVWAGALVVRELADDDAERDVFELRAGDCFDDPPEAEELEAVSSVPCDDPHDAEVYAEFAATTEGDDYPGESALIAEAERGCFERFEPFAGIAPESTTLAIHFLAPTQQSWENVDDREITCIVADPSGPTTGSLEGAAR